MHGRLLQQELHRAQAELNTERERLRGAVEMLLKYKDAFATCNAKRKAAEAELQQVRGNAERAYQARDEAYRQVSTTDQEIVALKLRIGKEVTATERVKAELAATVRLNKRLAAEANRLLVAAVRQDADQYSNVAYYNERRGEQAVTEYSDRAYYNERMAAQRFNPADYSINPCSGCAGAGQTYRGGLHVWCGQCGGTGRGTCCPQCDDAGVVLADGGGLTIPCSACQGN